MVATASGGEGKRKKEERAHTGTSGHPPQAQVSLRRKYPSSTFAGKVASEDSRWRRLWLAKGVLQGVLIVS